MKAKLFFSTNSVPRLILNKSLNDLCIMYKLDKSNTDDHDFTWHKEFYLNHCLGYTLYYETILNELRNFPIRMLEIGVCDKRFPFGSVNMWLDYFPNAEVWGMDNFQKGTEGSLQENLLFIQNFTSRGGNFVFGDQGDSECLKDFHRQLSSVNRDKFNIIIDDGSHCSKDILISLTELWDSVVPGGLYIIEDLTSGGPEPQWSLIHGINFEVYWALKNLEKKEEEKDIYYPGYSELCILTLQKICPNIDTVYFGMARDYAHWIVFISKKGNL